ncbi:hypothetical protein KCU93_g7000, partial [Aureobasidium melanogenum]
MQNVHEPPEEYHRILNQFRAWSNWSPIHDPEPEQNDPDNSSSESDSMLENAMLGAEFRRNFPGTLDLVSPFREPNIFDYLDSPSRTTSPTPHMNDYHIISGFLSFDPSIGREEIERYLAFEPTIQNRDFERETQEILNEISHSTARHQSLVEAHQSLINLGHRDNSVVYSRVEAIRQYDVYSAYSGALDEYWLQVHDYHRDAERLNYLTPRHGQEEHERLTTLPTINTHLADQTVVMPIGYTLTEEDFLEDVEEHSPDAHEWDFQERLRDLHTEEREASSRYQALLEEQQSLVQHGYHNTSVLYRHRYIWVCEEIWDAVHDTDEAWRKFTKLQDLELRGKLRAREITIEQIERIRYETQHQRDALTIRWMQAGIACIEAKRLVGFNAVAQHEATQSYQELWDSMSNTSDSFNVAAHQCYRRIDEALRDLDGRTERLRAETLKLRRALDDLRHGIPGENEAHPHRAHTQHNNNVQHVKRTLWHISTMVTGLRDQLRRNQNELQGAMDSVLGRLAREMPSWAREIPWMMQHLP